MYNQSSLSQYNTGDNLLVETILTSLNNLSDIQYQLNGTSTTSDIYLNSTFSNSIYNDDYFETKDYIFDRTGVRILFITLYSLVFCCCFFGKFIFYS